MNEVQAVSSTENLKTLREEERPYEKCLCHGSGVFD